MATIGQIYYNVIDARYAASSDNYKITTSGYESELVDGGEPGQRHVGIYENIVGDNKTWSKIGVQAPPGTQMVCGSDEGSAKIILIGRSGIYELDEDINIGWLRFVQPKTYEKDEEATEAALETGLKNITQAQNDINEYVELNDEGRIAQFDKLSQANQAMEEALALYSSGVRGIYKLAGYSDLELSLIHI